MVLLEVVNWARLPHWWARGRMLPNLLSLGVGCGGQREASLRHEGTNLSANSLDSQEFESFFRAHESAISGYLYRVVGDTQGAADLSQETFFRAWQRFSQIRDFERPRAWLFRVATNLALQHMRKRSSPIHSANALDAQFEPSESDPRRRVALRDLVRETLLELPPRPRALLVLREAYGFTAEEAANALGMSLTAAKVALWRVRLSKSGVERERKSQCLRAPPRFQRMDLGSLAASIVQRLHYISARGRTRPRHRALDS